RRGRPAVPRGLGDDQPASCRDGRIGAEPGHHRGGGARRGGSAVLPRRHAHRPTHAGHRAESGTRSRAGDPARPHGALHLPHQRRPGRPRFVSGEPDLPRQIHQRRDARPGRLRRRHRRRLQPGARRHRRRAAARRSGQLRCRVPFGAVSRGDPALSADRGDSLSAPGVARAGRRANGMRPILLFVGVALLIAAPFGLKPYGIYLLSLWAVMTIAAIGLNLPLGWSTKAPQDFYFFCLGVLALASIAAWWLLRSPWGRAFTALRENPIRASSLGIDTRRYTLMAFAIGSALGGVAGVLYAPLVQ